MRVDKTLKMTNPDNFRPEYYFEGYIDKEEFDRLENSNPFKREIHNKLELSPQIKPVYLVPTGNDAPFGTEIYPEGITLLYYDSTVLTNKNINVIDTPIFYVNGKEEGYIMKSIKLKSIDIFDINVDEIINIVLEDLSSYEGEKYMMPTIQIMKCVDKHKELTGAVIIRACVVKNGVELF